MSKRKSRESSSSFSLDQDGNNQSSERHVIDQTISTSFFQFQSSVVDVSAVESTVITQYTTQLHEKEVEAKKKYLTRTLTRLRRKEKELHTCSLLDAEVTHQLKEIREKIETTQDELVELEEGIENNEQLENQIQQGVLSSHTIQVPCEGDIATTEVAEEVSDKSSVVVEKQKTSFFPFISGDQILPKSQRYKYGNDDERKDGSITRSFKEKGGSCFEEEMDEKDESESVQYDSHSTSEFRREKRQRDEAFIDDITDENYLRRIKRWLTKHEELTGCQKRESFVDQNAELMKDETTDEIQNCVEQTLRQTQYHEIEEGLLIPLGLWKTLYPHQQEALPFFWNLHRQTTGGILGDEMGLGKTLEIVAFFAALHFSDIMLHGTPPVLLPSGILVVCPATVVRQWISEFYRWYSPFRCVALSEKSASQRKKAATQYVRRGAVVVMSYDTMRSDINYLHRLGWSYVVLDEGQKIRNPDAAVTLAAKKFETHHRLLLSGSPIQNDLKELWSLFDFAVPGRLGTLQGGLSSASRSAALTALNCATTLRSVIQPHFLRRNKQSVKENIKLPPKQEQILFCHLSPAQFQIYVDFLESNGLSKIAKSSSKDRWQRRRNKPTALAIFFVLSTLRKICNHPDLLLLNEPVENRPNDFGAPIRSGKMEVARVVLRSWKSEGHRALLFSQTNQMLDLIESMIKNEEFTYRRIDGTVSIARRYLILKEFNEDGSIFMLLLTTRVGGVGLNLTSANRVIIFDPDWNPMTDVQARERSWRIGQNKDVLIYRLILGGTVEEKIYHRQIFKQFLSLKILEDSRQRRFFKWNDLQELFQLPPAPPNLKEAIDELPSKYRTLLGRVLGQVGARHQQFENNELSSTAFWEKELLQRDQISLSDQLSTQMAVEASNYKQTTATQGEPSEPKIPKKLKGSSTVCQTVSDPEGPKREKMKKKTCYVETEVATMELFREEQVSQFGLSGKAKKQHNTILETLLDQQCIQTSVSHDLFELSHPDFDLTQRESKAKATRALEQINKSFNRSKLNPETAHTFKKFLAAAEEGSNEGVNSSSEDDDTQLQRKTTSLPQSQQSILQVLRDRSAAVQEAEKQNPSPDTECNDSWREHINRALESFFASGDSVSTADVLEQFSDYVDPGDKEAFRDVLNSLCLFDANTRTWKLKTQHTKS